MKIAVIYNINENFGTGTFGPNLPYYKLNNNNNNDLL